MASKLFISAKEVAKELEVSDSYLIFHSPNSQRPAKAIFSLHLYKSILFDLQFQKAMSRSYFFSIDLVSTTPLC